MAPKCYICQFYDSKKMSLFRVPNRNDEYSERGSVWLQLLDEKRENIHKIRICSEHFLKKKPSKADDYLDVDWVPNKNLGKYARNWKRVEHFFRTKKTPPKENLILDSIIGSIAGPIAIANSNCVNITDGSSNEQKNDVNCINIISGEQNNDVNCINIISGEQNNDVNCINIISGNSNEQNNDVNCINITSGGFKEQTTGITGSTGILIPLIPLKKRKIKIIEGQFFSPMEMQTDLTSDDIDLLFKYYQEAIEERDKLALKLSTSLIDVAFFKDNDKKTRFYTGLTNWKLLNRFFDLVKDFLPTHFNCKLSKFQMLVLTLMKLRLNFSFTDLGYRFQVDGTTASTYFYRCLYILHKKFENSKIIHWPNRRKLLLSTPSYFRSNFKEIVTIIIDCFEIFIERSSMLRAAAQAFSHYKHHETLKFLIGISLAGAIIFISEGFGGRTSDKEATMKSGFLDKLKEGDLVLADKGFLIEEEVKARNASLQLPCFVRNGGQLHPTEVESSRMIASLRIHVERVISILRQKFNICSDIAEMSAISKQNDLYDRDVYDKIVFVCSSLVNICPSVVTNDFEI